MMKMTKKLIAGLSFLAGAAVGGTGVYIWARKWINERVNQEMEQFREDMRESNHIVGSNLVHDAEPNLKVRVIEKDGIHSPSLESKKLADEMAKEFQSGYNDGLKDGKKIFKSQVSRDYSSYFSGPTPDEIAKAARDRFNEHMSSREFPTDDEDDEDIEGVEEETDEEREIREAGGVDIYETYNDYDQLKGVIRQTGDHTYLIDEGTYGEVFTAEEMIWSMIDGRLIDCTDHSFYSDPYRIIGELPAGKFEDGDAIYIRNTALQFDYEITFRNYDYDGYLDSLNP